MQIPYLPVRGRKLPRAIGSNIGPTMEICGSSGLPIPMLPRLHQSNRYIKRKPRAWRVQKYIDIKRKPRAWRVQKYIPRVMGSNIGPRKEICEISGLPIPMAPHLSKKEICEASGLPIPMDSVFTKAMVISKGSYGHEEFKNLFLGWCRYRTYQSSAANYPVSWGVV